MTGHSRIGHAGLAAARIADRARRPRLRCRAVGRREAAAPPLAAGLLRRRHTVAVPRTALRLAPLNLSVTVVRRETAVTRTAAGTVVREHAGHTVERQETVRERVERTVERVLSRCRREASVAPAPPAAAVAALGPAAPAFPPLRLALPAPAPAAGSAAPSRPGGELDAAKRESRPEPGPAGAPVPPPPERGALTDIPLVVDRVVEELDRRVRAQRERRGWIG